MFCPLFTNCILGLSGDGEEGGDPCPIFFWLIGVQKKWYKLSKLGGGGAGGVQGNLDKNQKSSYFFSGDRPLLSQGPRTTCVSKSK